VFFIVIFCDCLIHISLNVNLYLKKKMCAK